MSQKKVEEYKQMKKRRQQVMRRERLIRRAEIGGLAIVVIALVAWFSVSVFRQVKSDSITSGKAAVNYIDATEIQNYMTELSKTVKQ